ncbi:MAG: peptidylprolyl isomerase, partial [Bacteroidia bacterium]|nr:peptidylprolyl isomerase [Bacteroidia bacterium]
DFALLAMRYGTDATRDKGGDLGWFKKQDMVQPLGDTCILSPVGHLSVVFTEFGVHLVEVTEHGKEVRKAKIGTIVSNISASQETRQLAYAKANEFAGLNTAEAQFQKAVNEQGLVKRLANNISEKNKYVSGLESPKELIKWTFSSDKGEISPVFLISNKYVVALLKEVREQGYSPLDEVRTDVQMNVIKEKKAEKLVNEMKTMLGKYKTLEAFSQEPGVEVRTTDNITFSMSNAPNMGVEPEVIATAMCTEKDKITGPVKGNNGVYIIQITSITQPETKNDFALDKQILAKTFQDNVGYKAFESLKKLSDIEDDRMKY